MKKLLKFLLALVVVFVAVSFLLPRTMDVQREAVIKASPAEVYNTVANLRTWKEWGAWYEDDPDMKVTYNDIPSGKGARSDWDSKDGKGWMKISEAVPAKSLKFDMRFMVGTENEGSAMGSMTMEAVEGGTKLVWRMWTEKKAPAVLGPYFIQYMNGEVGKAYERGLANLQKRFTK